VIFAANVVRFHDPGHFEVGVDAVVPAVAVAVTEVAKNIVGIYTAYANEISFARVYGYVFWIPSIAC
jgi:hypothetical protein